MKIEEIAKVVFTLNERFTHEDDMVSYPPFTCCLNDSTSVIMFHDWVVWYENETPEKPDEIPLVDWVWQTTKDMVSDWMNSLEMGDE